MDAADHSLIPIPHSLCQVLSHDHAVVNGVRLHYVEAGDGPLVILLHGFPEFWYGWRHQIPTLAAAGFRVVAPDLRGYNLSERPRGVGAYRVSVVADDALALIRHLGAHRAAIVGSDWGGIVACVTAARDPEAVGRIALLNAPHPAAFARAVRRPAQMLRSAYALFFQLPWLPEAVIRARDFRVLRRILRRAAERRGAFTDDDIARYVEAFRRPGALTAALNYYRAAGRRMLRGVARDGRRISVPVLVIWGERDPFLGVALTRGLERWMPRVRVERLPDAGHFVQHDAPGRVNELLMEFLGTGDWGLGT
jgi:pimeloyl-ACP methyl ester carboxylesterase